MRNLRWILVAVVLGAAVSVWRWLLPAPPSDTPRIEVRAADVLGPVPRGLWGINVALWDSRLALESRLDLLRTAGVTGLRYPGGSMSDDYHWAQNRVDGREHPVAAPSAVFARLAEQLGAEVTLTLNYGSGTPEEAAAWVAWANGDAESIRPLGVDARGVDWQTVGYWAALRGAAPLEADDGRNHLRAAHPAPYGWRYFEIGNETYGDWETDRHGAAGSGLAGVAHHPRSYAEQAALFIAAIRAVDPQARTGVVTYPGEPYDEREADDRCFTVCDPDAAVADAAGRLRRGWNPILLRTLANRGQRPDFLALHFYPQQPGRERDDYLLRTAPPIWAEHARTLRRQLREYGYADAADSIEIAATELNSVTGEPGRQSVSLVNALFYADTMAQLAAGGIGVAHWWCLTGTAFASGNQASSLHGSRRYGSYAWLSDGLQPGELAARPIPPADAPFPGYHAAVQLAPWRAPGALRVRASSNRALLAAHATRQADGRLSLLVINKSPTQAFDAEIALQDFRPGAAVVEVSTYGLGEEAADLPASRSTRAAVEAHFRHGFAPYSSTLLTLPAP